MWHMASETWEPWDAVVLAGGRGARLDGVDKAGVEVGGRTMLAWVLDALVDAREVVVVGEPVLTERPVTFTREDPRYGGPVAGLLTGFEALQQPAAYVAVVAVDMPRLTSGTLRRLLEAARGGDGSILVDPDGRRQLAVVVSAARLAAIRPEYEARHGMALHRFLKPLTLVEVSAVANEHRDIDTWADLRDIG